MKTIGLRHLAAVLLAAPGATSGAEAVDVESLKRELKELRQRTEQLEQKLQQLDRLNTPAAVPVTNAVPGAPGTGPTTVTNTAAAPAAVSPEAKWSPSQPVPLFRAGPAYLNLSLSALVDAGWSTTDDVATLEPGGHDPVQRGFSLPNTELALDGAIDPYFKGFANITLKLDQDNETEIELEEVYVLSSSLPANLQLKGGQFLAEFGRQNQQHPHQWAFVDQPLVLNRMLGPDGLRNPGGRISWLVPLPFYTELFLGMFNGNGETGYSFRNPGDPDEFGTPRFYGRATTDGGLDSLGDFVFTPRLATSFDLTDTQTLLLGTSAALGPNDTGGHTSSQIYGVDAYWKWKPARATKGFPFVALQSEAIWRRFEAGADPTALPVPLPAETLRDWGFYAQALWGFRAGWVAALRGEYVTGNDGVYDEYDSERADRTRISPALTWYPSDFSKLRLQYNYDRGQDFGTEHGIWFQFEFLLGAHAAHKF